MFTYGIEPCCGLVLYDENVRVLFHLDGTITPEEVIKITNGLGLQTGTTALFAPSASCGMPGSFEYKKLEEEYRKLGYKILEQRIPATFGFVTVDKNQIILIFNENKGRYGYRRITLKLKNRGFNVNHKKVQRIMKEHGLQSIQIPKRRYSSYKGTIGKVADNLLKRDFKADKPNQKWAIDVTEFKVNNDKLYLSPIIDLFNGEVISYNLSRHPVFQQVVNMLEKAFKKIPNNTNLILHSDQGWQYQMKQYQYLLKKRV